MASILPTLISVSGQIVSRKRSTPSTYIAGKNVKGVVTVTNDLQASVQPPNSKFMHIISQLPEGKRTKTWVVVYSELDVFVAADDRNNTPADVVVYEGDDYEVQQVTHRRGRMLNFDVILAVRKET